MTCVDKAVFLYLFVFIAICEAQDKEIRFSPTAQALYPKGFRLSLEDDGYSGVTYRVSINKELIGISDGDIKQHLDEPKDGFWVYKNYDTELEVGDTIYFWIYFLKNGDVLALPDQRYTVTGFVKDDCTPVCKYAISKTRVQGLSNICKDQLIFNENFDQTSLSELKKWDTMIQFPTEPDYPFNVYIPEKTVSFDEGSFIITPVLTESQGWEGFLHQSLDLDVSFRCTGQIDTSECSQVASGGQILPPVTTAKITTRRSFNFMFGRVEVRAKLPSGSWIMPEINLEPLDNAYGTHNSGLMRIAFIRGNPGLAKKLYGGPVLAESEPYRSLLLQEKIGIDNWHKSFHNYTMIWRPDGIDLLVDGEQYGTVNPGRGFFEVAKQNNVRHASHWQRGTVMAPLDQMFHLTIGLRVGGVNDFADDLKGKPWRNSASKAKLDFWRNKDSWHPTWYNSDMRVDYVKVYAL